MIIRELKKYNLDDASKFVYDLTRNKEFRTPYTLASYEDIKESFIKFINHNFDTVLTCYKHGKIIGVISAVVELKRKQITIVDGPYTTDFSFDVINRFIQFLKVKFSGFSIVFPLYKSNVETINAINILRGHLFADILTLEYSENKTKDRLEYIEKLNSSNYEAFCEIMKNSKLIYQPAKIMGSSLFDVYLSKENNIAIIIKKSHDYNEICEVVSNTNNSDFITKIIDEALKINGQGIYKINIDLKDINLINLMIKIGFKQSKEVLYYRLDF